MVTSGKWADVWPAAPQQGPCRDSRSVHPGAVRQVGVNVCNEAPSHLLNANVAALTMLLSCFSNICFENCPYICFMNKRSLKERIVTWAHTLLQIHGGVRREVASSSDVLTLLPAERGSTRQMPAPPRR